MEKTTYPVTLAPGEDYLSAKYQASADHVMVRARVSLVGLEPLHPGIQYVGLTFDPPPPNGPLGVSTIGDAQGVELAKLAMVSDLRMVIVYRTSGFGWSDIVDLAVTANT